MRLLKLRDDNTFSLTEFTGDGIPHYAILSHTWGADNEEVTFEDLEGDTDKIKVGYEKLRFCAKQADSDGLEYFWVDTCCIKKSDYVELQYAINSMFRWYHNATKCYVYLSDVNHTENNQPSHVSWQEAFRNSRWFSRGWTLQELIAPKSVEFFTQQRNRIGDKDSLKQQIHEITGIPIRALEGSSLSDFTVDERMSWMENRNTRYEEDKVYSLQGIFDVHIPLIYGEGQKRAWARLQKEIQGSSTVVTLPTPSSTVPFRRDPDFVDRGTISDQIKQRCEVAGSRTALVGLGGIGKSQLAIEYAYRVRDRSPDTWVFWIHASNAARFEQSYRQIADKLKIPGRDDPKADVLKLVYHWLQNENQQKWFLIIDNFDDATFLIEASSTGVAAQSSSHISTSSQPLASYIPQGENGSILITTRSEDAALAIVEKGDIVTVRSMDKQDAEVLFQKKLRVKEKNEDVTTLVAVLEFMPLAIVQAATYIAQRTPRYSARRYIEKFEKSDKERTKLLIHKGGHLRRDWEASSSILTTWQISFDHVRQTRPSAAELLSLMSFFDRQGIPEALIRSQDAMRDQEERQGDDGINNEDEHGTSESGSDDEFENDIKTLRQFSFITIGVNGAIFEMHRLVQLAMWKWLEKHRLLESWKRHYIRRLFEEFPTGKHENWGKCIHLFPHAKGALTQEPKGDGAIDEWSTLLYNAAWYALAMGNTTDAESFSVKSMEARSRLFGQDHKKTLRSMAMVGLAYNRGGRWKEAEDLQVQVLKTSRRVLGAEHPDTLSGIANLASTYSDQGRWKEAEDLRVQFLETSRRVLGAEHPDTLSGIANLASTYSEQGRWKEAEDLQVQVLKTSRRVLGAEHPDTLIGIANLASTYLDQGRWKEAEDLEVQVLETSRRILGAEHPETLASIANLASIYSKQGCWKEAEDLEVQVVETSSRVLGAEHPDTLSRISNLALIFWNQGRYKEAESLEVQVLETSRRVLGAEHPETLTRIANLASTYSYQRRWKEGEDLEVQVLETRSRVLGAEHPETLASMNNLAITWKAQNRDAEALELVTSCLRLATEKLGPNHPDTLAYAQTYNNLKME